MIKKKKNNRAWKPPIWLFIGMFVFPLVLTLIYVRNLDNDIWYLLSEGRYIVQNGIYRIDPLSMHEGLNVVVQNWLSASIFWIIYEAFGEMGLLITVLISNFVICYLLYKICMLLSDRNYVLSLLIMFICDITLVSHYIVTRPQIFSFIILLSVIYVLELYISTNNKKYLIALPILSVIEANLHASLWWMIFLFTLPYVIDSFKVKLLRTQGYDKKPLFIAIIVALAAGLINPYGYKIMTFIFTSYGDTYMHKYISELLPFSFNNNLCKHMFIVIMAIAFCYVFFREGKIRVRYLCLFAGTLLLGFMSIKGFSHFILVSFFPMAYFFKDFFPKDFDSLDKIAKVVINYMLIAFTFISLGGMSYLLYTAPERIKLEHKGSAAIDVLEKNFDKETATVYSSFNNGGYVEFRGFKPYIDPRAELYLKKNNGKDDIFKENYDLQHSNISVSSFLKKYNFTHLFVQDSDILWNQMSSQDNYFVYYENTNLGYRLYARNDMVPDDEREKIIESYNAAVKEAIDKIENKAENETEE